MKRLMILGSVVLAGMVTANCANSREGASSASIMAPSAIDSSALVGTMARGGGGKPQPGGGGTTGGGGSIALAPMVTDNNHDGLPSFGDTVTFVVQTSATVYPWVTVKCYQNGTLVSQDSNAMFATSLDRNFTLGPTQLWTSGAASCTATLESWDSYPKSITALGSMSFSVN